MENHLPRYEKSFCERTEKNISCEIDLQEYLPNATKIIKVSANAVCDECEVAKDSVNVRGVIRFSVVYLSDFRDRLKCTRGECAFSHSFPAKGIDEAVGESGNVECTVLAFEEKGQVLSGRKLSVSCKTAISVQAVTVKHTELFDTEETDGIHKLIRKVEYVQRKVLNSFNIMIEENIALDEGMPEIREIVSCECCITSLNASCNDETANYGGKVILNCLYLGGNEGEEEYVSFAKELEFSGSNGAEGMPDGSFIVSHACVESANADAAQNNFGDMKVCSVNVGLRVSSTAYGISDALLTGDAFCTNHECSCEIKNIAYDCFVCGTCEKIPIRENVHANLGSMTDIISKSVCVSVLSTELSGKVPVFNLRAVLRVMGTNEQGLPECVSASFPIKAVSSHELPNIPDRCRSEAQVYAGDCECKIENGDIVCSLTLEICSCIYAGGNTAAVTAMVIDTDTEISRAKSEYILYYPDKSDTVWACAKKYRVSPSELLSCNDMGLFDTDFGDKKVVVIPSVGI